MVGTLIKNKNKISKPEENEMARIRIECAENGKIANVLTTRMKRIRFAIFVRKTGINTHSFTFIIKAISLIFSIWEASFTETCASISSASAKQMKASSEGIECCVTDAFSSFQFRHRHSVDIVANCNVVGDFTDHKLHNEKQVINYRSHGAAAKIMHIFWFCFSVPVLGQCFSSCFAYIVTFNKLKLCHVIILSRNYCVPFLTTTYVTGIFIFCFRLDRLRVAVESSVAKWNRIR